MSKMQVTQLTPELLNTILDRLPTEYEKDCCKQIVHFFESKGLPIKVKKLIWSGGTYRILCFIKKSLEAVIINQVTDINHKDPTDGFQIRISNQATLDNLNDLTENIRNSILNGMNCGNCVGQKCKSTYTFEYNGKHYRKCQYLCSNFRIKNICKDDIECIMKIIMAELEYYNTKKLKSDI